jgi:hypothetical protein
MLSKSTGPVSFDFQEEKYNLNNSGRGEWTEDGCNTTQYIDIDNNFHLERLLGWCRAHWQTTFKRSLIYGNSLFYHSCCNSFSRRGFSKVAGHPSLQSSKIQKIPGLKNIQCAEEIYRWLVQTIGYNTKQGQKTLFPCLNRYHTEADSSDEEKEIGLDDNNEKFTLKKRFVELQNEIESQKSQIRELKLDNTQLLNSSNNWFLKYQQLIDQSEKQNELFRTPLKQKVTNSFEFTEDNS